MGELWQADNTRIYFMCDFNDRILRRGQTYIYAIQSKKEGFKNISLGYTLDLGKKWKNGVKDMTFTFSAENVYLWKNYNGFDPDVSSEGSSSTLRRVDLGAYPKPRTFTFSVQVRY